jgi:hypothetical protein
MTDAIKQAATPDGPNRSETTPETKHDRRPDQIPAIQVRADDLEPYVGLKYLSRLFKLMAIILILLLASEVIRALVVGGIGALPPLLGEISELVVLAGLLWGCGDLATLFIDMGHDLRAARILVGRQLAHSMNEHHSRIDPGVTQALAQGVAQSAAQPVAESRSKV